MKILGTLTVDTPNALDKVTDLNADLLDGKSSELFLSRESTTGVYIADTAIVIDNSITPTAGGGRLKIYDRDSIDTAAKGLSIGKLYSDNAADITTIDADLNISLATDKDFKLFTNVTGVSSTNRLTVLSTGNVGINKATPTAKLQVHVGATETTLHPLLITASTKTLFDVDFSGNIGINAAADSNVQLLLQGARTSTHGYLSYGIKNNLTYVADTGVVASIYSMYIGTTITANTNFATAAALFINEISVSGGASTTKYGIYQAGANDSNIFNGNVGIGTTPSTWSAGKVLEIGNAGNTLWGNSPANMYLTENTYYNNGWKYASANPAATYQLVTNNHIWSIAPTGSINATVTFTEAMRINAAGNVGIGTNAPGAPLDVSVNTSGTNNVIVGEYTTRLTSGTAAEGMGIGKMFSLEDAGGNLIGTGGIRSYWVNPAIAVRSSNTDIQASLANMTKTVATFTSAGNVLINKTTDDGSNKLQVGGDVHVNGDLVLGNIGVLSRMIRVGEVGASGNNAGFVCGSKGAIWGQSGSNGLNIVGGTDGNTNASGVIKFGYTNTNSPDLSANFISLGGFNTTGFSVVGNILATGTVSGSNISNSYVWVFVITSTSTAYNTSDAYNASNNYVKPRTGDTVGSAFTDSATLPSFYNKNVVVYRSTTTSRYSAYEQVFPDITITTGGVCTISFAVAQTVGYVFRVIFS